MECRRHLYLCRGIRLDVRNLKYSPNLPYTRRATISNSGCVASETPARAHQAHLQGHCMHRSAVAVQHLPRRHSHGKRKNALPSSPPTVKVDFCVRVHQGPFISSNGGRARIFAARNDLRGYERVMDTRTCILLALTIHATCCKDILALRCSHVPATIMCYPHFWSRSVLMRVMCLWRAWQVSFCWHEPMLPCVDVAVKATSRGHTRESLIERGNRGLLVRCSVAGVARYAYHASDSTHCQ